MASNKPTTRLRELHGSGYEIKKGQPDIRGWDVRDDNRHKYGKVRDLIFDIRANKVRYLVIDIFDTRELELEKRTVLVPIGLAVLDNSDDDVILPTVTPFQLRALPRYDKEKLGAKAERDISHVFGRGAAGTEGQASEDVDNSFYEHDHFNEDNMQKNRRSSINPLSGGTTDSRQQTTSSHQGEGQIYYRKGEEALPLSPTADELRHNNNLADRNETDAESIRRLREADSKQIDETDEEYLRRRRNNL
ncbi:MAG TPA: PRC-barrel domain-containing protein [Flavisolibacter sp.]|jgi:hypothetical protein